MSPIGVGRIELPPHVPETCILPLYYTPAMGDTGIEPVFEEDTLENDFKTDILDDFSFDLKD